MRLDIRKRIIWNISIHVRRLDTRKYGRELYDIYLYMLEDKILESMEENYMKYIYTFKKIRY